MGRMDGKVARRHGRGVGHRRGHRGAASRPRARPSSAGTLAGADVVALDVRDEDAVVGGGGRRRRASTAGSTRVVHAAGRRRRRTRAPRARRGVGPRRRHQPQGHVPRRQARGRGDARPGPGRRRAGLDREHRERRGPRGHRGRQHLQRGQGWRRDPHQEHGDRLRPRRASGSTRSAPGFIDTPMLQGVFAMDGMDRRARRHHRRAPARPAAAGPRRSRRPRCSSAPPTRRSSPASPCPSTAATPPATATASAQLMGLRLTSRLRRLVRRHDPPVGERRGGAASWETAAMPRAGLHHVFGAAEVEPVYGPADAERPGQYPYTRGPYADDVPLEALDDADVRRLRHRARHEPALQGPARRRRRRPLDRVRPARR